MKLTILGSGSSWPNPKRRESAFHVQMDNGCFLVDAGEGCTESLVQYDLDWSGLTGAILTHFHNDHVAGLIPLLFRMYIFANRSEPFEIYGPPGLDKFIKKQTDGLADWLSEMPFDLVLHTVNNGDSFSIDAGVKVRAFEMKHKKVTLGYRMESDDKILAFSGDTLLCDSLYDLAANADVFVCEAGKPEGGEIENHITWDQIGQVAAEADAKNLILTHFNQHLDEEALTTTIKKQYSGNLLLGFDGMAMSV